MVNQNYPLYEAKQFSNLKELIYFAADKYSDKPAFAFERGEETKTISYCQFKEEVESLATALFCKGLNNGKVALIGENSYEWLLSYFAVVNSGNVIVPLDKELPPADIKYLIDHSGVEMFIFSDAFLDIAKYLRENGANIQHYINMSKMPELIKQGESAKKDNNEAIAYKIDNNALAAIMYTSGTTGMSKGVMLSHKNIANNTMAVCQSVFFPDKSLLVLPLHHIAGFVGVLCMLAYGSKIAINLSFKNLAKDFNKYKPGIVVLVPLFVETFYKQIKALAAKSNDEDGLSKTANQVFGGNLEYIICGAAPLDSKYVDGYLDFGVTVLNVYGLTECSGALSINRNQYFNTSSVGQIIPLCNVMISNPDENGHGEIYAKGDIIMQGYYKNEQATKETFDSEWFKTGDIGHIDNDGFLYVSGRKKNLIILSNGKNVYPEEIEFDLLKFIPYAKEAVVYAGNDEIIAEIFLDTENHPDCASQLNNDIVEFNRTLPSYKNIAKTVIRDTEFPKTTTKKIKRHSRVNSL